MDWNSKLEELKQKVSDMGLLEKVHRAKQKTSEFRQNFEERYPNLYDKMSAAHTRSKAYLSRFPKETYWMAGTVVAGTWFMADVAAVFIENQIPEPATARIAKSTGNQKKQISHFSRIEGRNIFNKPNPDKSQTRDNSKAAPVRTSLPIKLVGTIVLHNSDYSVATISESSGDVHPLRKDDVLKRMLRVLSVEPRRMIFENISSGNRKEFVELPKDDTAVPTFAAATPTKTAGSPTREGNRFNLKRSFVDEQMKNISKIMTAARAIPHMENGNPAGYKIFQIKPGSIYAELGINNGDIITGVNGDPIDDPSKAFELLNQLKTASSLELNIKRGGKQETFHYSID